jgi:hypothetical protein
VPQNEVPLARATPYAIGGVATFWTIDRLVTTFSM